jgi:putative hydrolase of the HAD superfamily
LFDFGNTLAFIDYELLAAELGGQRAGFDPLALELAEYKGREAIDRYMMTAPRPDLNEGYRIFFTRWMEAAGIPPGEVESCRERFNALHRIEALWRVVRPGTFEMLERFRAAGFRLGIVSNAEGNIENDARRYGLHKFFDVILDSHVVGVAKPDPRIFKMAVEALGVNPEEALFAGDIYSVDMVGARAAGIEGKLVDVMDSYHWVEHTKIRGIHELHDDF